MSYEIKRLDHLGVVAGTIKELNIIETIDSIIGTDKREEVTTGESIAAMIVNGLGFTSQPLSLTERFFEKKPLELFFSRNDIKSSYFNRDKLGKSLDKIYQEGCENLFYQLSLEACSISEVNTKLNSLDTTSLSLTVEYDTDSDEHAINITHGFSKDHRPDLKQCMHELLVSQDGGVPLMMKSWSGNSSDSKIFKERSSMLIDNFKKSKLPKYLIADSKLYSSKNSSNLKQLNFITRVPSTIKDVSVAITECFKEDNWLNLTSNEKYITKDITHYGIQQRWMIVKSKQSENRAKKRIRKEVEKEHSFFNKKFKEFEQLKFSTKDDAISNLIQVCEKLKYHTLFSYDINELKDGNILKYSIVGKLSANKKIQEQKIRLSSCYVIGTNIFSQDLSDADVIFTYKKQNIAIENTGFRFLKDPKFFAQSFFIKKPERIESLLFVMTLSLLVYSIAQRKLRNELSIQKETLPDQINKPTNTPTLRWIFQMLSDINVIYHTIDNKVSILIEGISDLKQKIIGFFGSVVKKIYGANLSYVS